MEHLQQRRNNALMLLLSKYGFTLTTLANELNLQVGKLRYFLENPQNRNAKKYEYKITELIGCDLNYLSKIYKYNKL